MTRHVTSMTIDDVDHYSKEEREAIIASYPEHERDARARGIPQLGSGRVFPVAEDSIRCPVMPISPHWFCIGGLDFGWDHPTAGVKLAWDKDADCIYVTQAYRMKQATPVTHAAALKPWGAWLPWAWPHDGLQHDKTSGDTLAKSYRDHGLKTLAEHATHPDGGYGLEAGISEMLERMLTGRWKVFEHLSDWFDEFRDYHRKDGLIVKERDDLISASRVGMMMKRYAKQPPRDVTRRDRAETSWNVFDD